MTAAMPITVFEATVTPHRSLDRKGIAIVIGGMCVGSALVTSLMYLLGAWPVIGFNGAELTLAILMLRVNIRAARARECLRLTEDNLLITRTDIHGRRSETSLAPYWLNVSLQERVGTVPKLLLTSRGAAIEVARQLGEDQKRDLAAALTRALHNWRNPVFDNPQLRN